MINSYLLVKRLAFFKPLLTFGIAVFKTLAVSRPSFPIIDSK